MQALCRKLMLAIASILIPVLLAEVGIADPSVFKTHIDKTAVVASIVQQNGSEGSRRRERVSRLSQPLGIAVDNATGKLYWTDSGTHKIYSANIDGTGQEIVVTWTPNPRRIAVDKGKIYWTDSGNHQIHRANLDGSRSETLVKWAYDPRGIAVDNASGKIYWADSRTHQIYRADLDGSLLEVLIGSMEKNVSSKLGRFAHKVI